MAQVPNNYGGLPKEVSAYDRARVAVLPVPYDGTCTYQKGARFGPKALLTASQNMELYDEELDWDPCEIGIHTLPSIKPGKKPEQVVEQVYRAVRKPVQDGKFIAMVGGEHSITPGLVRALKEKHGDTFSVLHFDAHSDLRQSYEGSRNNHACSLARVRDYIKSTVAVGIRSQCDDEAADIRREGIPVFYMKDMIRNPNWMQEVIDLLKQKVYLTIDIDCMDPGIMPSTGTPEPGGFQWWEMLKMLRMLTEQRELIAFDLTELMPIKGLVAPDFLAAKLVYKILGYRYLSERR